MDRVLIDSFLLFDGIFLYMIYIFLLQMKLSVDIFKQKLPSFYFFQRLNVFAQQKWQTKFHQKFKNKIRKGCCQAFYMFLEIAGSHRFVLPVFA
jgi:hypothetical protein